jgi:hypothetical protein
LFNVLANVGIVVGLILVILQMDQNEKLLRVQLLNQYSDSYIAADTTFAGENLPLSWQKSIQQPENLTLAEMRILEPQTFSPLMRWLNLYNLAEAGILDESVWKSEVSTDVGFYFGTPYGRAWWDHYSNAFEIAFLPLEVKELINQEMIATKNNNVIDSYMNIQKIIKKNKLQKLIEN